MRRGVQLQNPSNLRRLATAQQENLRVCEDIIKIGETLTN